MATKNSPRTKVQTIQKQTPTPVRTPLASPIPTPQPPVDPRAGLPMEVGGPGPDAEGNVPDPLGERQVKPRPSRVSIAMTKVVVSKAFNLTDDHGATVRYEVGEQEMPTAHADHWYAKNHID